jgi:mono/diheme cytochrome c family protein
MSGRPSQNFFWGAVTLVVVVGIAMTVVVATGGYNVAADAQRNAMVDGFLAWVRERSVDARAASIQVPPLNRPEMITDGASDYEEMCTGCHLAPGLPENEMRPGLDPKPPLLAQGPPDDPREEFWTIKHGIGMTAMSAWGKTHSDEEIWNMVAFLQRLPGLSPQAYRALVAKGGGHHHEMGAAGHMKM